MKKTIIIMLLCVCLGFSSYCVADNQTKTPSVNDVVTIPPPVSKSPEAANTTKPSSALEKLEIVTTQSETHTFHVEIADTFEKTRQGLMFRYDLDKSEGMLFVFNQEAERRFWMKNTYIPLDIIFIRADGVIRHIAPMATPQSLDHIFSNGPALAVLEIAGGEAKARGINIGDRIIHSTFSNSIPE